MKASFHFCNRVRSNNVSRYFVCYGSASSKAMLSLWYSSRDFCRISPTAFTAKTVAPIDSTKLKKTNTAVHFSYPETTRVSEGKLFGCK